MDKSEFQTLLQTDYVFCPHSICAPERFIKVLTVPSSELRPRVIDIIERPQSLEHTLDLSKLPDIAPRVERHLDICTQTEPDFIGLMGQVTRDYMMPPTTQFLNQPCTDCAEPA